MFDCMCMCLHLFLSLAVVAQVDLSSDELDLVIKTLVYDNKLEEVAINACCLNNIDSANIANLMLLLCVCTLDASLS